MNIEQAYEIGAKDYKNGKVCAPALNKSFIKAACASETKTIDLLDAWIEGWKKCYMAEVFEVAA